MRFLVKSSTKSMIAFAHDLIMVAASFAISLALRMDVSEAAHLPTGSLLPAWGLFIVIGALTFWMLSLIHI